MYYGRKGAPDFVITTAKDSMLLNMLPDTNDGCTTLFGICQKTYVFLQNHH